MSEFEDINNWAGYQKPADASEDLTESVQEQKEGSSKKLLVIVPVVALLAGLGWFAGSALSGSSNTIAAETDTTEPVATSTTAQTATTTAEITEVDYSQNPERSPESETHLVASFTNDSVIFRGHVTDLELNITESFCSAGDGFNVENQLVEKPDASTAMVVVRYENFLFQQGTDTVVEKNQGYLDTVANFINKQEGSVKLIGQAITTDSQANNHILAHDRADRVKEILVANGVSPEVVTVIGLGEQSDEAGVEKGGNVLIEVTSFSTDPQDC